VLEQKAAACDHRSAACRESVTDELLLKLAKEPGVVAEGESIFKDPMRCALCHKPDGGGSVGPEPDRRHGGSTAAGRWTSTRRS
jgi:mono/diheme cytochrome c family protein